MTVLTASKTACCKYLKYKYEKKYFSVSLCHKCFVVLLALTPDWHSRILFKSKLKLVQDQEVKSSVWKEVSYQAGQALAAFPSAEAGTRSTRPSPAQGCQTYPLAPSVQRPPCRQGWLEHSSMSVSQRSPRKPRAQEQEKLPRESWQVPPFRHGWDKHSSISSSQFVPSKTEKINPRLRRQLWKSWQGLPEVQLSHNPFFFFNLHNCLVFKGISSSMYFAQLVFSSLGRIYERTSQLFSLELVK